MSKFTPTEEQNQKIQWLLHCSQQPGTEWCNQLAHDLANLYIKVDLLQKEYDAAERVSIKLESAMTEIKYLRVDINQVVEQMPDRLGMWREALRILAMPRATREEKLADAVEEATKHA